MANTKSDKPIKGLGITRDQLVNYLRAKVEETEIRPAVLKELYDKEDLSLVTETHRQMVLAKVRMRILLAAADPSRTKPLVLVFLEEYNKEMVSFERQGRLELLGALQALSEAGEEERAVPMGR